MARIKDKGTSFLTWTGVGIQNCNALFTGRALKKSLFRAIVGRRCQAGQEDEQRHFDERIHAGLGRDVEVEVHFAFSAGGMVGEFEKLAAKRGDGGFCLNGHGDEVL